MSRPSRHGPRSQFQTNPLDKSGTNGTDAAAAVGLNKARAQFNEPIIQLQAIFPDWKEEDLISVLEEVRGDVELAVARISEGHVEQWGAVKHKKEKKPTTNRERERERDGYGHHTSSRGASSPRGRGRGGATRGSGQHPASFRAPRDRATNGSSPAPAGAQSAEASWSTKDPVPDTTAAEVSVTEPAEDTRTGPPNPSQDASVPSENKSEEPVEPPADDQKANYGSTSTSKLRTKPGVSGLSWAQIAKPVTKPALPPPSIQPKHVAAEPPSTVSYETVPDAPEPAREEPTTVEAPIWDDEPAQSSSQAAPEPNTDGWVDANPPATKSEDSWTDLGHQPVPEQPSTTQNPEPVVQQEPVAPQIQQPTPDTFSPPPGLANPAHSSPAPPKTSTQSNSRPAFGAHRPGSRYKSDQAVTLPSQAPPAVAAGFGITKPITLQFGSLNISGDDIDIESATPEQPQQPTSEQKAQGSNQPSAGLSASTVEALPPSQPSQSPASTYRLQSQQQQQPQNPPQEDLQAPGNSAILGGPAHTQAPSVNSALAMAPGPSASFAQHHPAAASHHTLAGLTHTPQPSGPQAPSHSHHPSFAQQASFPQQQQYDGTTPNVGGAAPFSGLGQSPQGQSQAFFRQTDSPFYNQSHTPINEQHGFGGSSGGFGQGGVQAGFNGAPGLGNDFGYDGQRNPYDTYSSSNSFAGRGGLRQDDVKGLGGSPAQGLSAHHGGGQPSPLGGQPSSGQGQGQYPGMGHMGNFYYNMNMNPYGYANSFYPPTFTSFVNPMYPAGGQTPPHGAKPGMNASPGIGASGNNSAYSANNSGHLQHASGGFDSDSGPNGTSNYHHANSALPSDFQKGPYTAGSQGFLGGIGASGGVGATRGPGGVASGVVGSTASPETAFKGYGGNSASGLGPADKSLPTQAGRGAPGVNQGQQQFYPNNRYGNVPQSQGYPQQQQQQQQQGDSYYSNYQRW